MLRSIVAVVVGYLVFGISAGVFFPAVGRDPHAAAPAGFMMLTALFGLVFAALGGFVAVKISRSRSIRHAAAVAVLIAVGATVSLITSPATDARWSQLLALLVMAPAALIGGWISTRKEQR